MRAIQRACHYVRTVSATLKLKVQLFETWMFLKGINAFAFVRFSSRPAVDY